jgi:Tat protein secretion system quality control protein TatD with DNase activity
VAARLAEVKGLSVDEVAAATRINFERLFNIPALAPAPAHI